MNLQVDEVEQVTEVSNSRAMNVVTKVMSADSSVQEHVKLLKGEHFKLFTCSLWICMVHKVQEV